MIWIQSIDQGFLTWLRQFTGGILDPGMVFFTRLGDKGILWIAVGILLLCVKRFRKGGFVLLGTLLLVTILGEGILKPLVGRIRPSHLPNAPADLLIQVQGFSFPSGHTGVSVASATVLTGVSKRLAWAAWPLAALISFSRLYLYVHYPSDVLAGCVLGAGVGLLGIWVLRIWIRKSERNSKSPLSKCE